LRISGDHLDADILGAIDAATEHLEHRIDRVLCTQSFEWSSDCFPQRGAIQIPHEPVQSITSIEYEDREGDTIVIDPAEYDVNVGNRQVFRTDGGSWPSTSGRQRSARLVYVAGYGDPNNVPQIFKRIILQLAGRFFYDPAMERSDNSQFMDNICAGYVRTGYE
jgi:uncharacterized phiE125 gp8 family phage protein